MNILSNQFQHELNSNFSTGTCETKVHHIHHTNQKEDEREDVDESVAKIVATVYNSGFYCLQCPFNIKFDRETGKYCIKKRSNIFLVLLVLIQLASISVNLYVLQMDWISQVFTLDDFTRKYTAIMSWLWILSVINFFLTLLRGQTRIQNSVNVIHETHQSLLKLGISIPKKKQITYPAIFFVCYFFAWSAFDVLADLGTYFRSIPFTQGYNARYVAILENGMLVAGEIGRLTTHFIDVLCLAHAYTVYLIFLHFVKHLTAEKSQDIESVENSNATFNMVLDMLNQLCKLSDALDSSFGFVIAFSCFGLLPYYAIQIQNLFKNFEKNFYQGFRTLLMVGTLGLTLALAAEANSKMNHVISWIQLKSAERRKTESLSEKLDTQEKIGIVMNQIQRNQIGLRAKFYTVTYGFLGSMVGLLLTYSVMITQFQSADASRKVHN